MSNIMALLVSKKGVLLAFPGIGVRGNHDVIMSRFRFGFYRDDELHGGRHHWRIHLGKKVFHINDPGDYVSEEQYDEPSKRVTREVQFRGSRYTYHSGLRLSYYKNFPDEKKVVAIWMPDTKHADEFPAICSMGIHSDILDTLQCMWELGCHASDLTGH